MEAVNSNVRQLKYELLTTEIRHALVQGTTFHEAGPDWGHFYEMYDILSSYLEKSQTTDGYTHELFRRICHFHLL